MIQLLLVFGLQLSVCLCLFGNCSNAFHLYRRDESRLYFPLSALNLFTLNRRFDKLNELLFHLSNLSLSTLTLPNFPFNSCFRPDNFSVRCGR